MKIGDTITIKLKNKGECYVLSFLMQTKYTKGDITQAYHNMEAEFDSTPYCLPDEFWNRKGIIGVIDGISETDITFNGYYIPTAFILSTEIL